MNAKQWYQRKIPISPCSLASASVLARNLNLFIFFYSFTVTAMTACKLLFRASLSPLHFHLRSRRRPSSSVSLRPSFLQGLPDVPSRPYAPSTEGALSIDSTYSDAVSINPVPETPENPTREAVELLLSSTDEVGRLMKMERKSSSDLSGKPSRWFPYLDRFSTESADLSSDEVLEALDPYIMEERKNRLRNVVKNRTYSVCLVVEGLTDFGNVSAVFRSADALGFQSVHVISFGSSKRYKDNRHVSMGAEKWLDIELWDTTKECFEVLKSRGYRIATTHLGVDAVSVCDMDWSSPTAIVLGNENRGISDEALELSDLHCIIPMKGMVDSFNVSVAAGILMHHAVWDRSSRLGYHSELTLKESQILLAELSLRHSKNAVSIVHEYAKRRTNVLTPRL